MPQSSTLQTFHFRVLEDALWDKELPFPRCDLRDPAVAGTGNATFGDLDGRMVQLPPMKPIFRHAWYRIARVLYVKAVKRGQQCAIKTNPSEKAWNKLRDDVASSALCGFPLEILESAASGANSGEEEEEDEEEVRSKSSMIGGGV